ncbi:MAG: Undecaprenyl-phosphate galactosephosphotransferase [Ilumatobacteraceae bacterium]|nr:Undecaprenyl-phosphate galactosephosphotransferase [Ilumatobacteraceae bacterium]
MTDVIQTAGFLDPIVHRHSDGWDALTDSMAPSAFVVGGSSVRPAAAKASLFAKRAIDIAVAVVVLILALPAALLIAVLVKVTSDGPVFFRQKRVGKGGEEFTILKFRSMHDNTAELIKADPALWAEYVANDYKLPGKHCQITKVGYVLRKLSLDELPQLLNVLKGDMSVVGIRPLLSVELAARPMKSRELYAEMRPGLTGLWQVEGRSSVQHEDRFRLDDNYVLQWTLRRDLALMARTPLGMLRAHDTA